MLVDLVHGIRQLLYPDICARCETILSILGTDFCPDCARSLTEELHFTCPRCSSSVGEHTDVSSGCSRCSKERYHFDSAMRLGPYGGLLRDVILAMKNSDGQTLAECVGRLWHSRQEKRFRSLGADVIIPVPLHWRRQWSRGYNQSESLSEVIGRLLKIEHRPRWLKRIRFTESQAQQSLTARRANVRGVFRTSRSARFGGRSVLLVDDVLTTGSTASEAARALKEGGAKAVHVAVLAHR